MKDTHRIAPEIDYLAKDYASFRRLMLDHLSQLVPDWRDQSPADLGQALVDVLAYAADHVSYYQDAVASEAYLGTARLRRSVRRHARLLDYQLHEGCNARAWVQIQVNDKVRLPRGTQLLTRVHESQAPVVRRSSADYHQALLEGATVFETMYDCCLLPAHNEISFYHPQDHADYLSRGSTSAYLEDGWRDDYGPARMLDDLQVGDVLLFEELRDPHSGLTAKADPGRRHAVRLTSITRPVDETSGDLYVRIEWAAADALPFALYVAPYVDGRREVPISVARGNLVLVDHGRTIEDEELPVVQPHERYRPRLRLPGLTHAAPYHHHIAHAQPASAVMAYTPREAAGWVRLRQRGTPVTIGDVDSTPLLEPEAQNARMLSALYHWTARADLLNSGPLDRDFLVAMESDGRAHVRFGYGGMGRQPVAGDRFTATYRVGNGTQGNVSAGTIACVVADKAAITHVRNPLPARGGRNPEDIESARLNAPHAFRTLQRCATEADYAEVVSRHPAVAAAVAQVRWVGSGRTVFIYARRAHGQPEDGDFRRELRAFLEPYRLMGHDVEIEAPRYVPVVVGMRIHLEPNAFPLIVRQRLDAAFGTHVDGGQAGFFGPQRFGFGRSVHQSQVIAHAMAVPGVARVEITRFRRADSERNVVLEIPIGPTEIACAGDIAFAFGGSS